MVVEDYKPDTILLTDQSEIKGLKDVILEAAAIYDNRMAKLNAGLPVNEIVRLDIQSVILVYDYEVYSISKPTTGEYRMSHHVIRANYPDKPAYDESMVYRTSVPLDNAVAELLIRCTQNKIWSAEPNPYNKVMPDSSILIRSVCSGRRFMFSETSSSNKHVADVFNPRRSSETGRLVKLFERTFKVSQTNSANKVRQLIESLTSYLERTPSGPPGTPPF